jgi:hypothetical protein
LDLFGGASASQEKTAQEKTAPLEIKGAAPALTADVGGACGETDLKIGHYTKTRAAMEIAARDGDAYCAMQELG